MKTMDWLWTVTALLNVSAVEWLLRYSVPSPLPEREAADHAV